MGAPNTSVTLTPEQIAELNKKLSKMRHDINNNLSLLIAAVELVRMKPELRDKWLTSIGEQPAKIINEIAIFSAEFEKSFGITRD